MKTHEILALLTRAPKSTITEIAATIFPDLDVEDAKRRVYVLISQLKRQGRVRKLPYGAGFVVQAPQEGRDPAFSRATLPSRHLRNPAEGSASRQIVHLLEENVDIGIGEIVFSLFTHVTPEIVDTVRSVRRKWKKTRP